MLRSKNSVIISLCILVFCIVCAFLAYSNLSPSHSEATKTISITVNHLQGSNKTIKLNTDAKYLGAALEKKGLIAVTKGHNGLSVTSVDGEAANDSEKQWWGFTKSGEYVDTGIDMTPIEDGDSFEFSLHAG